MKILKIMGLGFCFIIISVYLAVWSLSPVVASHFLGDFLAQNELELTKDSTIRLNLLQSSIKVTDLAIKRNNIQTYQLKELDIRYSIWRLLQKEVRVDRLRLKGMSLLVELDGDDIRIAGYNISNQNPDVNPETTEQVDQTSTSEENPFIVNVPKILFEDLHFNIRNQGHSHSVVVDSLKVMHLKLHNGVLQSEVDFEGSVDQISIEFKSDLNIAKQAVDVAINLDIENISPESIGYLLPENIHQLNTNGQLAVNAEVLVSEDIVNIKKLLVNTNVEDIHYADDSVDVGLGSIALKLDDISAQLTTGGEVKSAAGTVSILANNIIVNAVKNKETLLALGSISSKEIKTQLQGDNINVGFEMFSLEDITLSKTADFPPMADIKSVNIQNFKFSDNKIMLNTVSLGASDINAFINSEGKITTLIDYEALASDGSKSGGDSADSDSTAKQPSQQSAQPQEQTPEETSIAFQLDTFVNDGDIHVNIDDKSNQQAFKKTFKINKIQVNNIDTTKPEQQTVFTLLVQDEEYFKTDFNGWIKPFANKLNLEAKGNVKEFPLYEVAPYLRDTLGFEVESGQLDANIDAKVTEDVVDSKADLLMRGAKFKSSQQVNDETNLIGQTAIPLNVALNMLRDGDGNIELKIPVKGNVDDPSFGLQHVLGLVLKKVAMSQAKSHLITMFVPYAKVVSVAMTAGEEALKIRFEDLIYNPAQIQPEEKQQEFIQQFSTLMKDKKDLRVSVCPIATPEELNLSAKDKLDKEQYSQLLDLAKERGKAFKASVIKQSGIDSARMLLCSPKVDSDKKAKPRIDFKT